jgi:hypothetical protein
LAVFVWRVKFYEAVGVDSAAGVFIALSTKARKPNLRSIHVYADVHAHYRRFLAAPERGLKMRLLPLICLLSNSLKYAPKIDIKARLDQDEVD